MIERHCILRKVIMVKVEPNLMDEQISATEVREQFRDIIKEVTKRDFHVSVTYADSEYISRFFYKWMGKNDQIRAAVSMDYFERYVDLILSKGTVKAISDPIDGQAILRGILRHEARHLTRVNYGMVQTSKYIDLFFYAATVQLVVVAASVGMPVPAILSLTLLPLGWAMKRAVRLCAEMDADFAALRADPQDFLKATRALTTNPKRTTWECLKQGYPTNSFRYRVAQRAVNWKTAR
jgi:hypothetical protein